MEVKPRRQKGQIERCFKEGVWLEHCFSFISALFLKISLNQKMAQLALESLIQYFLEKFWMSFRIFKCRKIREVGDINFLEI